jgi:alpha-mannosidase
VALLSAATYGWSVAGHEMRMTLLRSPRWPDPQADIGRHKLSLAVMPHAGNWRTADVTAEALRFNAPLLLGRGAAAPRSFLDVPGGGLHVDTVKRAEGGDGLVVRLYDPQRRARHGTAARRRAVLRRGAHEPAGGAGGGRPSWRAPTCSSPTRPSRS